MERESTPRINRIKTYISEQFFFLPEEIMEEILSRMPVKSLLKFRCVSKPWRSLIDSDRFIKKHLENSTKNRNFARHKIILNSIGHQRGLKQCSFRSMLNDPSTDQFTFSDLINTEWSTLCLVGCCNGLVCILLDGKHFILWNPSTRKTKNLPAMDRKIKFGGHIMNYGFGVDDLSGDYKVFGIASFFWVSGRYQAICKVYSLQTNSWKLVKNGDVSPFDKEGKFASGKLHWDRTVGLLYRWNIISFDLRSEAYGVVELPSFLSGCFNGSIGVLGGCLSVLCDYFSHLDMWVMKQYGVKESWDKVVTIPHLHNPLATSFSALFALGPNGEVLLTYGSTFVVYYPEDNGFQHCQVTNHDSFREADIYVESLVSLGEPGTIN